MGWTNQAVTLIVLTAGGGFTGLFAYSPAPGPGNLIASIAAAGGTDPFGNAYGKGIITYGPGPSSRSSVGLVVAAGFPDIGFASGAASETRNAQIVENVFNASTVNEQIALAIFGPQGGGVSPNDSVELQLLSSTQAAPGISTGNINFIDTANGTHSVAFWGQHGFTGAICQAIIGAHPGTSNTTLAAETWQTLPLNSPGFVAGATLPRYRFEPIGTAGIVRLTGQVKLGANQLAGATIATLPAGYVPAVQHAFLSVNNLSGAVASISAAIGGTVAITTGGAVNIVPAGSTGNVVWLDGIEFPLD